MLDWQTTVVALIVLAALLYVARRGLSRLRSFRASSSCAAGCGKCGESEKQSKPAGSVLVQIKRARD